MTEDSPLNEVDQDALEEYLNRDPEAMVKDEEAIKHVLRILRQQRKEFEAKDIEAHAKGKYGKGPKRELTEQVTSIYDIRQD